MLANDYTHISCESQGPFQYLRGLGSCVYDVKFRRNGAANKSITWSVIDSRLWLKTFTVAPSPMKEDIGFFQSGPSSMSSKVRENQYRTCHNFNKDIPCVRTPCPYPQRCNKPGCGRDYPGIRCSTLSERDKQSPPRARKSNSDQYSSRHRGK